MARGNSVQQQLSVQTARKFLIRKISVTASTGVITSIGATDALGNTLPASYTLMVQPINTDIYYELREAGATTAITPASGSRPGTYVVQFQQEVCSPLFNAQTKPGPDAQIDIYPLSTGQVLLFWMG